MSPPSTTVVDDLGAVGRLDAQLDEAVGQQQPIARAGRSAARPANVVERRPGPPTKSPVAIVSRSPASTRDRPPVVERPVRIFGPPRSWRIADFAAGARGGAARMRANVAACDSCVPCEKFRRKMSVPPAISASSTASESLAGPTVAMIFGLSHGRSSLEYRDGSHRTGRDRRVPREPQPRRRCGACETSPRKGVERKLPLVDAEVGALLRVLATAVGARADPRNRHGRRLLGHLARAARCRPTGC